MAGWLPLGRCLSVPRSVFVFAWLGLAWRGVRRVWLSVGQGAFRLSVCLAGLLLSVGHRFARRQDTTAQPSLCPQ